MSYSSIALAVRDNELVDRVAASVAKEALSNPTFGDTNYGKQVKLGAAALTQPFLYAVAVATEAAYASAVAAGNPHPGQDEAVITDAALLAAVQAHWPADTP